MADTTSALLQLTLQETGNNNNSWGTILNATLQKIEDAIASTTSTSTTGGNTTLTDDQARKPIQIVSGALVSNATIKVPDHARPYIFRNATSGAFTVTVQRASGGGSVVVPQGKALSLYSDGTDVKSSADVVDASIDSAALAASAVTSAAIAASAVTSSAIAANAVTTTAITASAVTNAKLANMTAATVKANVTGGAAAPTDVAIANLLDTISTTQGSILIRGASGWTIVGPSTAGAVLTTAGAGANPIWGVTAAALPTASGGPGQYLFVSPGSGAAATLPAGGTWAFFIILINDTTALYNTSTAGTAAGGTLIGSAVAGNSWIGFQWRVA